jgi:hypothetical protein
MWQFWATAAVTTLVGAIIIHTDHAGSGSEWALIGLTVVFLALTLITFWVERRNKRLEIEKKRQLIQFPPWRGQWRTDVPSIEVTLFFDIFTPYFSFAFPVSLLADGVNVPYIPRGKPSKTFPGSAYVYELQIKSEDLPKDCKEVTAQLDISLDTGPSNRCVRVVELTRWPEPASIPDKVASQP